MIGIKKPKPLKPPSRSTTLNGLIVGRTPLCSSPRGALSCTFDLVIVERPCYRRRVTFFGKNALAVMGFKPGQVLRFRMIR